MHYLYLGLAIVFELIGSSFIKMSDGYTKPLPTAIFVVAYIICFYFLSIFKQGINVQTMIGIGLILIGVVVMHLSDETSM